MIYFCAYTILVSVCCTCGYVDSTCGCVDCICGCVFVCRLYVWGVNCTCGVLQLVLLQTALDIHRKKAPVSLQPFQAHMEQRFEQMKDFVEKEYDIKVSRGHCHIQQSRFFYVQQTMLGLTLMSSLLYVSNNY